MIKKNYHTHTSRCGHAVGTDEEYVEAAIKAGIRILGFSDHAAYDLPCPGERMNIEEVEDYTSSILHLKEKYKDQIEIHLGMEVEYYESEWKTLSRYRTDLEYLILGQHNLEITGQSSYEMHRPEELSAYCDRIEMACQRYLCDIIAHPDVCLWSYPRLDESVKAIANRIADIALYYNIPVELNCGSGVKDYGYMHYEDGDRYAYPTRTFFEIFAEKKVPVIIGLDIHNPSHFLTDLYLARALDIVKGLNLNFVSEDYNLIEEAEKRKQRFLKNL